MVTDVGLWLLLIAIPAAVAIVVLLATVVAQRRDGARLERDARRAEAAARAWQRSRTAQAMRQERERR